MKVRVCRRDELKPRGTRTATLSPDSYGFPRIAVLALGKDQKPKAYLNQCQHLPVPLDAGSGQFLDPSGSHFECATHGAEYRIDDGYCFAGPCEGTSLEALELVEENDELYVIDPAASETG